MPETSDPEAALGAPDVPTRAAACRDLSVGGGLAQLARLVQVAAADVSPAVRLAASAAAADILSRHRLPPRADALSIAERESLLATVARTEPGASPALLQVVGELRLPGSLRRLRLALRDPRVDVRVGACVALLRLCASAASNGDDALAQEVVALLSEPRIRAETRAELARLCANVGFTGALEPARALVGHVDRVAAATLADAVARLEASEACPPSVYVDRGVDPLAVSEPGQGAFLAWTRGDVCVRVERGVVTVGALGGPLRRLFLPPGPGAPARGAIQIGVRTFWEADPDEVVAFGDALLAAGGASHVDVLLPCLPEGASTLRLRGAALVGVGRHAEAYELLSTAAELRKAPPDTWWWLAESLDALGRADEARAALERFVQKSPKRAPHVAEARARLNGSGA